MPPACLTLHIYARNGKCLYYHEWSHASKSGRQEGGGQQEDFKLLFGLFWSMKTFAGAMDPKGPGQQQVGAPRRVGEGCTFQSFRTSIYKLHFLESPSGLKFVLTTEPAVGSLSEQLQYIYASLFVEQVVKNPMYTPGEPFLFEPFSSALNKYMRALGLLT